MNKRVVIIGGGHGQAAICRGIKHIEHIDISAIVTVADDGGSTGRLRRQFHIPAMGDIRNVMIALAESETMLGDLMDYRFEDPSGDEMDVSGHNLGNLILTTEFLTISQPLQMPFLTTRLEKQLNSQLAQGAEA